MQPDRDLDRELRDLGPRVEYPPVPDLARSVRGRLEAEDGIAGSPARSRPQLWWIAAAALVLLVAVPVLSLAFRGMGGGAFSGGAGGAAGGGGAMESGGQEAGDAAGPTNLAEEDESLAAGAGEGDPEDGTRGSLAIRDTGDGAGETGRPNSPVPDVVGMELTTACEKLSSRKYVGYVIRAVDDTGAKPGRVVEQKPLAGSKGYVGGPVDLTVSEPYSEDVLQGLPRGRNPACLDATR